MMTILWLSRHAPEDVQEQELRALYAPDPLEIVWIMEGYGRDEVDRIITEMEKYDPVDLVVVLPLPMLAELTRKGIKPLRAIMTRRIKPNGDKVFTHLKFERIASIELVTEEPQPCNQRQGIRK